jgi:transketolase
MEFIGVRDRFGQSGEPQQLLEEYGMSTSFIASAARKIFHRNGKG